MRRVSLDAGSLGTPRAGEGGERLTVGVGQEGAGYDQRRPAPLLMPVPA